MPLTPQELDTFLSEPHIAVVATSGPKGKPHAMPIWYLWRDGAVLFHTGADSKKMRNLRADPRISIVVDSKTAPYKAVVIDGTASGEAGDRALAEEIAIHYLGERAGRRYAEHTGDPGTLVRVRVKRVISWDYARESNP